MGNDRWLDEHVVALVQRLEGKEDTLRQMAVSCEFELVLGFSSENGQGGCSISSGPLAVGVTVKRRIIPGVSCSARARVV